ncbi:hypothetical protein, partial [Aquitalea magnusonii]|uniref:hypothetical protein n=1 Tax=Aquitalea magnusonii TaxID=332411 RepID=UPI00128F27F0
MFLQAADAQIIRSLAPVMLGMAGLALDDIVRGVITRRQLIKTGMAGSVVLLAAGFLASPQPDLPAASQGRLVFLQAADAQIIRSLA